MMRRSVFLAVIIAAGVMAPSITTECRADCYGGGYGFGGGGLGPYGVYYGLWGSNPYAMGRIPTPPYFALHPPVYYSYPVARTYGYSPFPYPGCVPTPSIAEEVAEPLIIENPHIDGTGSTTPPNKVESDDGIASTGPQTILNPFVRSSVPTTTLAKTDK